MSRCPLEGCSEPGPWPRAFCVVRPMAQSRGRDSGGRTPAHCHTHCPSLSWSQTRASPRPWGGGGPPPLLPSHTEKQQAGPGGRSWGLLPAAGLRASQPTVGAVPVPILEMKTQRPGALLASGGTRSWTWARDGDLGRMLPCSALHPHLTHPRGSGPFRPRAWAVLAPAVPRGQWEARPWLLQGPRVAWPGSYSGHSSHQSLSQQASSQGPGPARLLGRVHPELGDGKSQHR